MKSKILYRKIKRDKLNFSWTYAFFTCKRPNGCDLVIYLELKVCGSYFYWFCPFYHHVSLRVTGCWYDNNKFNMMCEKSDKTNVTERCRFTAHDLKVPEYGRETEAGLYCVNRVDRF